MTETLINQAIFEGWATIVGFLFDNQERESQGLAPIYTSLDTGAVIAETRQKAELLLDRSRKAGGT